MSGPSEFSAAFEWSLAALALRSIFTRECENPEVMELRVTVSREHIPGLAVVEFEVIGRDQMALSGGVL